MATKFTEREVVIALYELNGGDFDKIVETLAKRRMYSQDEIRSAVDSFMGKHKDERIITIVDDDYPMEYRDGRKKPQFIVLKPMVMATA